MSTLCYTLTVVGLVQIAQQDVCVVDHSDLQVRPFTTPLHAFNHMCDSQLAPAQDGPKAVWPPEFIASLLADKVKEFQPEVVCCRCVD